MKLADLRKAVASEIRLALQNTNVEEYAGKLGLAELKRLSLHPVSACVSILNVGKVESQNTGETGIHPQIAVYVVTVGRKVMTRDVLAMDMVETIVALTTGNRWGISNTHPPTSIRATNLSSARAEATGVSLWAITWDQRTTIDENLIDESGVIVPQMLWNGDKETLGNSDHYDTDQVVIK